MSLTFPNSPSTNDTHTTGGSTWKFDGEKWVRQGTTGPQGIQGVLGRQGLQGLANQGVQGLQGLKGSDGSSGSNGSNGSQGIAGSDGSSGSNGAQGTAGSAGSNGSNGSNGAQGTQGEQGPAGGSTGTDYNDSVKVRFGTGNDLEIYHDGSNSYIDDSGTGRLNIRGNTGVSLRNYSDSEQFINCYTNGAVELFHDNSKKLETTSSGVTISGSAQLTSNDGLYIRSSTNGTGAKIKFSSNSSGNYGQQGTIEYLHGDGDVTTTGGNSNDGWVVSGTEPRTVFKVEGDIEATSNVYASSDISLKDNIVTYENALDKVLALRGVEYDRNDLDGVHEVGLIAQEVEEIIPELVGESKDGLKNIAYGKLTAVLIEAVKELKKENDALSARIKSLEDR